MTIPFLRTGLAVLACATSFVLASPTIAATVDLKADLKASNEVPPNDSKGTGQVSATYDTASKKLSWKGNYSGLSGPAIGSHFHAGMPGKNGGVVIPIFQGEANAKTPFEGSATLTDEQAADMLAGRWYVNVHTPNNKGGELRGQLTK
jgi:hypothetical protein